MYRLILSVISIATIIHAATPFYPDGGPLFGGKNINITKVPYLVSIFGEYGAEPLCSGVAISEIYVLTVAHCVQDRSIPSYAFDSRGTQYKVTEFNKHENFLSINRVVPVNDLMLVRLGKYSAYDNAVKLEPIKMFNVTEDISAGVDAFITGPLNLLDKFSRSLEKSVASRTITTVDVSLCEKAYESVGGINVGQICAGYPGVFGKDAGCQGDSGTPLIIEGRLAGILSSGNGCIKSQYPGIYTNVAYYRNWIDQTMREREYHIRIGAREDG